MIRDIPIVKIFCGREFTCIWRRAILSCGYVNQFRFCSAALALKNQTGTAQKEPSRYRSQDVRVFHAPPLPAVAHLGKGAASPPVASPGPGALLRGPHQRRFALWTSDRGDFISPWTLDRRETSLSPRTPIDQAYAAMDPQQGFRAPAPRTGERAAPVPLPNPRRIGCALYTGGTAHEQRQPEAEGHGADRG
jgi:hypothetical protein